MSEEPDWQIDFPPDMRALCHRFISMIEGDQRYIAILAAGSAVSGQIDRFSDLDLKVIVREDAYEDIYAAREKIAGGLGLIGFTYTHIIAAHDRCLFCLYSEPFIRVDLHFATIDALDRRVEDLVLVWDRDGAAQARLRSTSAKKIILDPDEFDGKFWIWAQQTARRLGRGELFEALDMLSVIRAQLLGRMAHRSVRRTPFSSGMRRIESYVPHLVADFETTIPSYDPCSAANALFKSVALYQCLREDHPPRIRKPDLELQVLDYIESIRAEILG